ncbi:MAG: hypothetical protein P0Y53_11910 [Candidatus Pseudobacter hemicellulosilyticus]|uniref:Uncharacterized protein n=1 Tax=Candidatus Pseudobacter hemicellulosilyticus TaxID=3121375 RepID=A0AAJ5WX74_9BACT|nr:MAG: hypothetical protein P0Y53_11910 [Pseudobacter sp.]
MKDHQPEKATRISNLIMKHLRGELLQQEMKELHTWINAREDSYLLFEECQDLLRLSADLRELWKYHWLQAYMRFSRNI